VILLVKGVVDHHIPCILTAPSFDLLLLRSYGTYNCAIPLDTFFVDMPHPSSPHSLFTLAFFKVILLTIPVIQYPCHYIHCLSSLQYLIKVYTNQITKATANKEIVPYTTNAPSPDTGAEFPMSNGISR